MSGPKKLVVLKNAVIIDGADCGFREATAKGHVLGPRLWVCGKGLSDQV